MSGARLLDSFTAPKEVLDEFAEMAEEEDVDPFAQTASKRQIASRQSDYHNRRFNRQAHDSADAFKASAEGEDVEGPLAMLHDRVTSADIARVVAKATGIPVQSLLKGEREKLVHVSARCLAL